MTKTEMVPVNLLSFPAITIHPETGELLAINQAARTEFGDNILSIGNPVTEALLDTGLDNIHSVTRLVLIAGNARRRNRPLPTFLNPLSVQLNDGKTVALAPWVNEGIGGIESIGLAITDVSHLANDKTILGDLLRLSDLAHGSLNLDTVAMAAGRQIIKQFGCHTVNFALLTKKNGLTQQIDMSVTVGYDEMGIPAPKSSPEISLTTFNETFGVMLETGRGIIIPDTSAPESGWVPRPPGRIDWGSFASVPIHALNDKGEQEIVGFLSINHRDKYALAHTNLELLQRYANRCATPLENARLYAKDPLTQALTREQLSFLLEKELSRAIRYAHPLSAIMLDIDFFKGINDTYGHKAGDDFLETFVRLLNRFTRGGDLIFRYGGEEFIVLMPETDEHGAFKKARIIQQVFSLILPLIIEKIASREIITEEFLDECIAASHQQIETMSPILASPSRPGSTVSCGAGTISKQGKFPDSELTGLGHLFLKKIDEALYSAKDTGRNRVILAETIS